MKSFQIRLKSQKRKWERMGSSCIEGNFNFVSNQVLVKGREILYIQKYLRGEFLITGTNFLPSATLFQSALLLCDVLNYEMKLHCQTWYH